ncbi:MAG: hypothetical protein V4580_06620 [Bacteroidota bacterium]
MFELIYTPPFKVLCMGANIQYRFLKYKRLSCEVVGGMKFFFKTGPDFATIRPLKKKKDVWYINFGLITQLDLGVVSPFADLGGDGILTVGTEVNLRAIHRKPKKRYKLQVK